MQGFTAQQMDMRRCGLRGATQLASASGQRVTQTAHTRHHQIARNVECAASTSGVKLPATHLQASQSALQQLQATKGTNSELIYCVGVMFEALRFPNSTNTLADFPVTKGIAKLSQDMRWRRRAPFSPSA